MNKKVNSLIFMLVATVVNIILLCLFFLVGLLVLNFIAGQWPDSSLIPALIMIVFVGAIVLSFFVYSRLVKWATKKFDLEEKMDPLFSSRRNRSRDRMD